MDLSSAGDTRAPAVDLCGLAFETRCLSFKLGPFGIAAPRPVPGRLVVPLSGAVVFGRGLGVGDDVQVKFHWREPSGVALGRLAAAHEAEQSDARSIRYSSTTPERGREAKPAHRV